MGATKWADIIVPEIFIPYLNKRIEELSAFWRSGIVQTLPELASKIAKGGVSINMPYWDDLEGDAEHWKTDSVLTPNNITAKVDRAAVIARQKMFGTASLTKYLAGDDPQRAIAEKFAEWWVKQMQRTLFLVLEGAFSSSGMSSNALDISGASGENSYISGSTFIDAAQKLGDKKSLLTMVGMNSLVESYLAKRGLIAYIKEQDGSTILKTFMDKIVVVDDAFPCSNTTGIATTYLFAPGAIGYGEGVLDPDDASETGRDIAATQDVIVSRKIFALHPRGVQFNASTVTSETASDPELSLGTNYTKVYPTKDIRIVQFKHKINLSA